MLSGPPETAIPMGPLGATTVSRSDVKRSTRFESISRPHLHHCGRSNPDRCGLPRRCASRNDFSASVALCLGLAVAFQPLEVGTDLRAVHSVHLGIGLARLGWLAELHQRLGQIIKAILRPFAGRIGPVIGEK